MSMSHQEIIATLSNEPLENSHRYQAAVTALRQIGESPAFLLSLKNQLLFLNRLGFNRVLAHFSAVSNNGPANEVTQAFNHLKNQIRLRIPASDVPASRPQREKILLLKTLIAAIELKNQPDNVMAFNDIRSCYTESLEGKSKHKFIAALHKFIAFFVPQFKARAEASAARAKFPTAIQAYRNKLEQPNQVYLYPGQLQEVEGIQACTSIALTTGAHFGRMNNADIQALVRGLPHRKALKDLAHELSNQVQRGIQLNREISLDEEDRYIQKTLQTVESRLQDVQSADFNEVKSLCAKKIATDEQKANERALYRINTAGLDLRPRSQYSDEVKNDAPASSLGNIIAQAEAGRDKVVFAATASNFNTNHGHTITFFSQRIGSQRVYGIADSAPHSAPASKGKAKYFDNRAALEQSLLNTFSQDGENDFVSINAYDVGRR